MAQLSDFLDHIKKNNIVRSNRFRITFSLPAALITLIGGSASVGTLGASSNASLGSIGVSNIISLTCLSTNIPGITISTTETSYGALPRQIVNGRSYDNFSTSFLLSGPVIEKKLMDSWYNIIFDDTNNSVNYYDDYVSSLLVEQLDQNNNVIYVFELMEAFPIHIGDIKLDRSSTNEQSTLDVAWAFHRKVVNPDAFSLAVVSNVSASPSLDNSSGSGLSNLSAFPATAAAITSVPLYADNGARVSGIILNINTIITNVKQGNIRNSDGVMQINAAYRDFNSISSMPTQVKSDVLVAVNRAKSQMINLNLDPQSIT